MAKKQFDVINLIRTNPNSFSYNIDEINNLITETNKKEIKELNIDFYHSKGWKSKIKYKIYIENICSLGLSEGNSQFQAISGLLKNTQGMDELEFQENLCIEIPDKSLNKLFFVLNENKLGTGSIMVCFIVFKQFQMVLLLPLAINK